MHEVSLVQGLISQVKEEARRHNATKVERVVVQIGPFSGVVLESFTFAFDALKKEEPLLAGAFLTIKTSKATYKCINCGKELEKEGGEEATSHQDAFTTHFSPLFQEIRCPECKEGLLYPSGGDEIILLRIEME